MLGEGLEAAGEGGNAASRPVNVHGAVITSADGEVMEHPHPDRWGQRNPRGDDATAEWQAYMSRGRAGVLHGNVAAPGGK